MNKQQTANQNGLLYSREDNGYSIYLSVLPLEIVWTTLPLVPEILLIEFLIKLVVPLYTPIPNASGPFTNPIAGSQKKSLLKENRQIDRQMLLGLESRLG